MFWTALTQWSFEPVPVLGSAAGAFLYCRGRRHIGGATRSRHWDRGDTFFAAGLGALLLGLISPIATYDTQLQWDHMLQHVLLLAVAPPLILLGDPFRTAWAAIRSTNGHQTTSKAAVTVERIARSLHGTKWSLAILLAFSVDLLLWHLPGLYNVTLQVEWVHNLEHTLLFGLGLLFWDQVVGSFEALGRPSLGTRVVLVVVGMLVSWALAIVIAYATQPLYQYPNPAEGLSSITDQQIAAGIMWVPGGVPFLIALIYFGAAWFDRDERRAAAVTALDPDVK